MRVKLLIRSELLWIEKNLNTGWRSQVLRALSVKIYSMPLHSSALLPLSSKTGARGLAEIDLEFQALVASFNDWDDIEHTLDRTEAAGAHLIEITDPSYPELLRSTYDPPFLLYLKGPARPRRALCSYSRHQAPHAIRLPYGREALWRAYRSGARGSKRHG